jgi:hypothetical protein
VDTIVLFFRGGSWEVYASLVIAEKLFWGYDCCEFKIERLTLRNICIQIILKYFILQSIRSSVTNKFSDFSEDNYCMNCFVRIVCSLRSCAQDFCWNKGFVIACFAVL